MVSFTPRPLYFWGNIVLTFPEFNYYMHSLLKVCEVTSYGLPFIPSEGFHLNLVLRFIMQFPVLNFDSFRCSISFIVREVEIELTDFLNGHKRTHVMTS
jgi:hypothetical protein